MGWGALFHLLDMVRAFIGKETSPLVFVNTSEQIMMQ